MGETFHKFVKMVGTGPKSNRDLSQEEAASMMEMILEKRAFSEQIAAFLLGWRLKPETDAEFRGALEAIDRYTKRIDIPDSVELGYPFDGKNKSFYLLPLVGRLLSKKDPTLIVSGGARQPAKGGVTLRELDERTTWPRSVRYFDRADYAPALEALTPIRQRLGLRTALNTLEKLPYVASSRWAITGVFHRPYVRKYAAIFAGRYERLMLLQGSEGSPEIFGKSRFWIVEGDTIREDSVDPRDFGIGFLKSWRKITLDEALGELENPSEEVWGLARLNAAVIRYVAGRAKTIEQAYEELL